jgi:predicted small secreted protein
MLKKTSRFLFCLTVLAVLIPALSACNTIEGVGKDVKSAGESMSGAAKSAK